MDGLPVKRTLLATIISSISVTALAENPYYVTFGGAHTDHEVTNEYFDDYIKHSYDLELSAGYMLNNDTAVELSIVQPSPDQVDGRADVQQARVSGLHFFGDDMIQPYVSAGLGYGKAELNDFAQENALVSVGAGLQLAATDTFFARAEYRYDDMVNEDIEHNNYVLEAGMRFGGTLVTVFGSGFLGDAAAMCRFGPVAVPARLLTLGHPGQLECISPLPAVAGYVSVEVSFNGQDYSATGVHFEYQQPVAVRALEPSRGPIEGGTFVNVTGSGFAERAALLGYLWCRFNQTAVVAAWHSASEVHCIAPEHASGVVSVELTQNEQQHTSDGVQFEYRHVVAHGVHPRSGPVSGGTLVEVRGANIEVPDVRGLFCQFGGAEPVAATHASRELVRCIVPASQSAAAGVVPVRLLNNDAVYTSMVAFTYRTLAVVDRIHPVAGVLGGGTLVTVYGTGFTESVASHCKFAGAAVPARLISPGQLECASPRPSAAGYVALEVTMNEQDYSIDGTLFEFQPAVAVLAVEPSRGPVDGGSFVNVTGTGFSHRAALLGYLWCRFNQTAVVAAWVSSTEVNCIAPEHAGGAVAVELTQNDQQYAGSLTFEYEDASPHSIDASRSATSDEMSSRPCAIRCAAGARPARRAGSPRTARLATGTRRRRAHATWSRFARDRTPRGRSVRRAARRGRGSAARRRGASGRGDRAGGPGRGGSRRASGPRLRSAGGRGRSRRRRPRSLAG